MNGCLGTIHNLCSGETVYAVCVQYRKEPPKISNLKGKCNSVEDVLEDIYSIIDKGISTEGLGEKCLDYGKDKTLNSVMKTFENEICNLKNSNKRGGINNVCEMSIEECGFDLTGLIDKCTGVKPKTLGELLNILISKHNE